MLPSPLLSLPSSFYIYIFFSSVFFYFFFFLVEIRFMHPGFFLISFSFPFLIIYHDSPLGQFCAKEKTSSSNCNHTLLPQIPNLQNRLSLLSSNLTITYPFPPNPPPFCFNSSRISISPQGRDGTNGGAVRVHLPRRRPVRRLPPLTSPLHPRPPFHHLRLQPRPFPRPLPRAPNALQPHRRAKEVGLRDSTGYWR